MEFTHRKLPREAAASLRLCPVRSVKPFALMLAPVYVFMRLNMKFVAVKAPLDFFTPEELEKLAPLQSFFLPPFVDRAIPFRDAATRASAILSWEPQTVKTAGKVEYPEVRLAPAPFELSDAILRLVGPLWGDGLRIEPFFVSVFVNELCDVLPGELLRTARDKNVEAYERGVFRSAWGVFLALHLGFCDLGYLNRLRLRIFEREVTGHDSTGFAGTHRGETDELIDVVTKTLVGPKQAILNGTVFASLPGRLSQKLTARLERVKAQLMAKNAPLPTIHGPGGFLEL